MKNRALALLLVLAMTFTLLPTSALAASPADELTATVTDYYQTAQKYVLTDWEELAAVYAVQADGDYESAVDLSAYVLRATPSSGAGAVFASLMKGDLAAAETAANALASEGALIVPPSAYTLAANMLAVEAYNRSAPENAVTYDVSAAVTALLSFEEADHTFLDYDGSVSYDNAAMAILALSCYKTEESFTYQDAITAILNPLMTGQNENGTFSAWGAESANSTAVVLWALKAIGDTTYTAKTVAGLLTFYVDGGGFKDYTGERDAYATKQATLALAEQVSGASFYTKIKLNSNRYTKSVTMQLVKQDGSFAEKALSLTDADTPDSAAGKVLGEAVSAEDYRYYKDGAAITELADGDTILAVYKDVTGVAYFSADGSGLGVCRPTVDFGGSVSLTLKQFDGSAATALSGVPIDLNGDGYGDVTTDGEGAFSVAPIQAATTLTALKSDYSGTYIDNAVAVLPASVTMTAGDTQTKTVALRVEGKTANLLHYAAYDVTGDGSGRLTVYDAVTQALAANHVAYTADGGYISAIGGQGTDTGNYDGWSYLYNGSSAWVGMAAQPISDGDEILVYYGYGLGWGTDMPALTSSVSGGALTLTVTKAGSDPTAALAGVVVTLSGESPATTDENGQVTFADLAAGTYTVQLAKADGDGVPLLVRLAPDTTVAVTAEGASQGGGTGGAQTAKKICLTVTGHAGDLYPRAEPTWYVGMTALDALSGSGLTLTTDGTGKYVSGINGIMEFTHGANSGWKYRVNGTAPNVSAADYVLAPNDELVWYYVTDYTHDSSDPAPVPAPEVRHKPLTFSDTQGHWGQEAVQYVFDRGVMEGDGTRFDPDGAFDRSMLATVLYRLEGKPISTDESPFADVTAGAWYTNAVIWAAQSKLMDGDGGKFDPEDELTREQLASILYAYARLKRYDVSKQSDLSAYADAGSISAWALDAVKWANAVGLLMGRTTTTLVPCGALTRGEAAVVFMRYLEDVVK